MEVHQSFLDDILRLWACSKCGDGNNAAVVLVRAYEERHSVDDKTLIKHW
jgi:hypothetical protein